MRKLTLDSVSSVDDETLNMYIKGSYDAVKKLDELENSEPLKIENTSLVHICKKRKSNSTPDAKYWGTYTNPIVKPGHFTSEDLCGMRMGLLDQGISPNVLLSGVGEIKALKYNDMIIHKSDNEAMFVCMKFIDVLHQYKTSTLAYRGESLATFTQLIFDEFCKPSERTMICNDVKKLLAGQQNLECQQCGDAISEIDHVIPRACHGEDALENYAYLCFECHKNKTCEFDNMKINMEDQNPWVSRFNEETWKGFVESKKPLQVLAKLHEAVEEIPCFEIDVRSCRLNGILEGNIEDIPVYSPLETFEKPLLHQLYDYQWIDIGCVRSPLKCYEYDGARWYSKAEAKVLLQNGICKWNDFQLGFDATSHHKATSLANILRRIAPIWLEVGKSFQADVWAADRIKKQDIPTTLCKRAMLAMIGMWGRIHSYKFKMKTGHRHDCLFEGPVLRSY